MIKLNYRTVNLGTIIPFSFGQCQSCKGVFAITSALQGKIWEQVHNGLDIHKEQLNCCLTPNPLWISDVLLAEEETEKED